MSDKIREIQGRFKNIHGSDQLIAALSYVPLFGWIFPYYGKKDDELCQFHGKQAMQLNVVMLTVYFSVWILENFPIVSWFFGQDKILHPISQSAWLITAMAFIGLSIYGAFKAFSEEKWEIPGLSELVDKTLEQIKSAKPGSKEDKD